MKPNSWVLVSTMFAPVAFSANDDRKAQDFAARTLAYFAVLNPTAQRRDYSSTNRVKIVMNSEAQWFQLATLPGSRDCD